MRLVGRFEDDPCRSGVDHNRHLVLRAEPVRQHRKRCLHQRQFVLGIHGAGHVDQEHQIGGRTFFARNIKSLDPDPQQPRFRIPRSQRHVGRDRKRPCAVLRRRIVIAEIVEHFLGPHRFGRRGLPLCQETADIGVGTGIDINREGGHRFLRHRLDRCNVLAGVAFAAFFAWHRIGHWVRAGSGAHHPARI